MATMNPDAVRDLTAKLETLAAALRTIPELGRGTAKLRRALDRLAGEADRLLGVSGVCADATEKEAPDGAPPRPPD